MGTDQRGAEMVQVKDKVIDILAQQAMLDPGDIAPDASLESLGVDSLGLVEIVFAIEEEFDIQIPFNANEPDAKEFDISSVGSIVSAIEALVAGG